MCIGESYREDFVASQGAGSPQDRKYVSFLFLRILRTPIRRLLVAAIPVRRAISRVPDQRARSRSLRALSSPRGVSSRWGVLSSANSLPKQSSQLRLVGYSVAPNASIPSAHAVQSRKTKTS